MRQPIDFVNDAIKAGTHWTGILSVARQIRGGLWYDKVKAILQERKIMPVDLEVIRKERQEILARYRAALAAQVEANKPKTKKKI